MARERPVWWDAFLLGVVAFALFAATAMYHDPLNNDPRTTSLAAWQLAHHGNATLTPFRHQFGWLYEVHGRYVTDRLPGTVFFGAAFYAWLGSSSAPDIFPAAIAAAAASAAAVALVFTVSCRLVSRRAAFAAAAIFALGTGTWTVSGSELWTHGPGQAAVLAMLVLCVRERWLLAGLPAGFAILVRPHLAVAAFALAAIETVRRRSLRPLRIGVGSIAGLVVLLVYNHALWGRYTVFGGYAEPALNGHLLTALAVNVTGALVSPERGMLVLTPALLLLLPGVRAAWRNSPWWPRAAAVAGLSYAAVQLATSRFSGGDGFFSYRTTLEPLTLCVPLLVLAWKHWTARSVPRRVAFAALAGFGIAGHAMAAVVHWTPSGSHSPWRTYLQLDILHHVGPARATAWIVFAVALAASAAAFAWARRPQRMFT